jgi:hypothetical protein
VNIIENLGEVKTSIVSKYESLGGRMVPKLEDRIKEVMNGSKIGMFDNKNFNTVSDIRNRIMFEANKTGLGYNGKVNDWLVYNGINQYLHDDNLNITSPEKRRERDSRVLEYMLENA